MNKAIFLRILTCQRRRRRRRRPAPGAPVPLVLPGVLRRDALHAVDLDLDVPPAGHRVGHLVDGLLVHLHAVDREPRAGVELLVADVALEVLGLLVLDQDLLVVELAVAVPEKRPKVGEYPIRDGASGEWGEGSAGPALAQCPP